MKEKVNQMFKDKLLLVMLVLGLLTIVAAAGVVTIQRGNQNKEESPYLDMQEPEGFIAEEAVPETNVQIAGKSDASEAKTETAAKEEPVKETKGTLAKGEITEEAAQAGTGKNAASALTLNFTDTSKMTWPVQGNVILDYSMDSTVYFPTLDQYKCNPAMVIQADVSTPVVAPANARILEIGTNEEIGNYIVLDMGNDYTAVCGQLKELQVVEHEYVEQGRILGYVAEPTKYYSIEGNNVFLEMKHQEKPIDPLNFME